MLTLADKHTLSTTNLQNGFTLIELMIVVAIIGLLAAIGIPAYNDYVTDSANNACYMQTKGFFNAYRAADQAGGVTLPTTPAATGTACGTTTVGTSTITAAAGTNGDTGVTCTFSTGVCALD